MNYKLVKELKDAGFPQHRGLSIPLGGEYINKLGSHSLGSIEPSFIYNPPLSELIKECGEYFGHLDRIKENGRILWACFSPDGVSPDDGGTPEEAVIQLWLRINNLKKQ